VGNAHPTARQFFDRGYDKYKQGDYQGTIENYTEAIRLKPDYAIAYNNRGLARERLEDYEGAISKRSAERCADYTQAIRLDPDLLRLTTAGVLLAIT